MTLRTTLSPGSACQLFNQFVRAYHGSNSYGGHIMELYGYTLLGGHVPGWNPVYARASMFSEEERGEIRDNLVSMIDFFRGHYPNAVIRLDNGVPLTAAKVGELDLCHRVHIEVVPKDQL